MVKQLRWLSGKSGRLGSYRLGFDSKWDQTNHYTIGMHSFPAGRSALKGQSGEQAGKFTCVVGKGTQRDSHILVWQTDGW